MRVRRSLLFAPGNRPEIFDKALATGADVVCVDLEDAVPAQDKARARDNAVAFLRAAPGAERMVRINSLRSADGMRDLLAIVAARPDGGVIFLPKVADVWEVRLADEILTEAGLPLSLAVLIESTEGMINARAIAAGPRVVLAVFGGVDYAAELGVAVAAEPLLHARHEMVLAGKRAGVDVMDVPSLAFRDNAVVESEAQAAKMMGFTGKACLHPANVAVVNAVFTPTAEEIARAEKIVAAYEASPNGLAEMDGKLIEKPVVRAMQRILAARPQ